MAGFPQLPPVLAQGGVLLTSYPPPPAIPAAANLTQNHIQHYDEYVEALETARSKSPVVFVPLLCPSPCPLCTCDGHGCRMHGGLAVSTQDAAVIRLPCLTAPGTHARAHTHTHTHTHTRTSCLPFSGSNPGLVPVVTLRNARNRRNKVLKACKCTCSYVLRAHAVNPERKTSP